MGNNMKSNAIYKKSKWASYSWGDRIFLIIVYTAIILITFICLYPLYYTVVASVSEPYDVYSGKVSFLPSGFTLEAYMNVFKNDSIWQGYANSIFYTVAGTIINMVLTVPAAYALSKKRMLGRSALMMLFVITMYFGGGMIPTYLLFKQMHLLNTRLVLLLCGGVSVFNVIVARTYFQNSIPESMYEAAKLDGANEFLIFFKLAIPLSAPILAVIGLYYAVGHWNSYFNALIYTTDTALQPLQLVLRRILILNENIMQQARDTGDTELMQRLLRQQYMAQTMKFSVVFIASAPMLIIYPFVQKFFVKGVMVGSLKG